ncbi:MAG: beta-galactosidase trimerization domain-containing protein [Bacteroidota bacterium]
MEFKILIYCFVLITTHPLIAQDNHDYLVEKYDALHGSARQEAFRKISPMPAGVVYIQRPGEGETEMREHFRLMKKLGFNSLKQIMTIPGWELEDVQLIALEEGLVPWWYGEGGWAPITDELLKKLKISPKSEFKSIRENPKMIKYQQQILKDRILKAKAYKKEHGELPKGSQTAFDPEVGGRGLELSAKGEELFADWAKETYKDIEKLNEAWSLHHHGLGKPFDSWEDFTQNWREKASHRNYKDKMDIFRFKAEHGATNIEKRAATFADYDSSVPFRGGGEMGLFLPAAYMGVDMEAIADVIKDYGSFYPSTHLSWHFNLSKNEIVRPFYIQASIMNDFYKGGWTGGWESTGGPQQFDGEKGASDLNSYYVDGGTILQLFMSQMAAGFKGFGIWCWSIRTAGKEGGEYALLDRNNQPTDRAIKLGMMGKAMQKYRDEIWQSHKEPTVGVLLDWNNDAAWGAMSVRGRETLRNFPIESRIGAARALMNANVPFEYVTPDDIKNGLVMRYKVIYLPSVIAMDREILTILDSFVQQGGRLVIDLPGGKFDENTSILPTGETSLFAKIFGATLDNFQFSGSNKTVSLAGKEWTGFIADITPKTAEIKATYSTGKPAILENNYGEGSAVILGLDMAHQCFEKDNVLAEQLLITHTLGEEIKSPYACEGALVYQLASPQADHYYFINDGAAKSVIFRTINKYSKVTDALTGEEVDLTSIRLEADDARWIRMEK